MNRLIKSATEVIVIRGNDKGKRGKVASVSSPRTTSVVVEGVNRVKRHMKPNPRSARAASSQSDSPLHVSQRDARSIPKTGKADPRSLPRSSRTARRVRVAAKSGSVDR